MYPNFYNPNPNYLNENDGIQNLYPYPENTLLGGNPSLSRPRPMYNVNPQHNLPSYGLDINANQHNNNNAKNNNYDNSYKKCHKILKEFLNAHEDKLKDIIIIIL